MSFGLLFESFVSLSTSSAPARTSSALARTNSALAAASTKSHSKAARASDYNLSFTKLTTFNL